MDLKVELSINRAENELITAEALFKLSELTEAKAILKVPAQETFYSSVMNHSYYAIFYSARAYLAKKGMVLPEQGQHQAVYYAFRKLVREGNLASELLAIYDDVKIKAETLLEIFEKGEENRTKFTYKTLAQANKEPANSSIKNAQVFFSQIKNLIV